VKRHQADYPIATMCRLLGLSTSGYYARRDRPPSKRAESDAVLTEKIGASHGRSRGTYGVPRIHADLAAEGQRVGRKRVGRLMRDAGLAGVSRRRGVRTTLRDKDARPAPDLVSREFSAQSLNRLWVADITYIPTCAGFLYLAMVLDVCSRRIVGWSMATHLRAELVLEALNMAIGQRRPTHVIHHSDQGTQYTSIAFGQRCREIGVEPSMGSIGDCFDNAMAESFFATLECELIDRRCFQTQTEARMAVFEYIEGWYNPHRRHSALGQISPAEFERRLEAMPKPSQIEHPGSQNAGEADRAPRCEPQRSAQPSHPVENVPSSPAPPSPWPEVCRGVEGRRPLPSPGTLPHPLENASRFPQPTGHTAGERSE
jgi:putative transposase